MPESNDADAWPADPVATGKVTIEEPPRGPVIRIRLAKHVLGVRSVESGRRARAQGDDKSSNACPNINEQGTQHESPAKQAMLPSPNVV